MLTAELGLRQGDKVMAEVEIMAVYSDHYAIRAYLKADEVAGVVRKGIEVRDKVVINGEPDVYEVRALDDGQALLRDVCNHYATVPLSSVTRVDN